MVEHDGSESWGERMILIPIPKLMQEAKRIAAERGLEFVSVSRDDDGLWKATVKRKGLRLMVSIGGSTRRSALRGLIYYMQSERSGPGC